MMENITVVHNKVALITGGSRGIGRAIASLLSSSGYSIALNYNTSEKEALELKEEIIKLGGSIEIFQADISNEIEVKTMIDNIISKFGKIDALINNASVCFDSLFHDKTTENFRKTLEVNVIGTFLVSKYVGQIMHDNKYGRIINLSSTNGINTYFPMCIDYDASKSAINSLTHNLAVQFAPYVNVNAIAPGFIATESEINGMDSEFIELEREKIMVKRVGEPKDVANLVQFLLSPQADFINNQIIKIDGGIYGDC